MQKETGQRKRCEDREWWNRWKKKWQGCMEISARWKRDKLSAVSLSLSRLLEDLSPYMASIHKTTWAHMHTQTHAYRHRYTAGKTYTQHMHRTRLLRKCVYFTPLGDKIMEPHDLGYPDHHSIMSCSTLEGQKGLLMLFSLSSIKTDSLTTLGKLSCSSTGSLVKVWPPLPQSIVF